MRSLLVPEELVNLPAAPSVATSIAPVQTAPAVTCTTTAAKTQTFSASTTVGNWLIVCAYENTGTGGTVTGGGVTTWTKQASTYWNGIVGGEIWYGRVTSPGTVVTYAPGGGSNFCGMASSEWTGILVATPVSSSTQTNGSMSPLVGLGSVASAIGQLLVVSAVSANQWLPSPAQEPGVGWVNLGVGANGGTLNLQADYMLNPPAGTYTPSWAVSSSGGCDLTGVVFNPVTATAIAVPGQIYFDTLLQQVGQYSTTYGWQYTDYNTDALFWMEVDP